MSENAVHVKLEYEEAVESKKSLLSLEMGLLRVIQSIRKYKHSRNQEIKTKIKLNTKVKSVLMDLRKIEKSLPKIRILNITKKETPEEKQRNRREEKYNLTVEQELQDIQRKLGSLQN